MYLTLFYKCPIVYFVLNYKFKYIVDGYVVKKS